jgi:hypothetical protein
MKTLLINYINKFKQQYSKYIVLFPILCSIGFIFVSIQSFNNIGIYCLFAVISIAIMLYKFYKNEKSFKYILLLFIMLSITDIYIFNNYKSLDDEYKQLYKKCDNSNQCNKVSLDNSYNNYIHYITNIKKLEGVNECTFIAKEIPKIYNNINDFYNLITKSNNFMDFYIQDFYKCLKSLSENEIKGLNIIELENYSSVYKNVYFKLNTKYSGSILDLKHKTKFIVNTLTGE